MEKKSKQHLKKLEGIYRELGYIIRYEKGNFAAGSCVLHGKRIIVVNKLFTPEGQLSCLTDLLNEFITKENLILTAEMRETLSEIYGTSQDENES